MACEPVHYNDSANSEKKQILSKVKVYWIEFYNTSNNVLYVSFDGTSFRQVKAGDTWSLRGFSDKPIKIDHCWVKGSAAETTFEIVYLPARAYGKTPAAES